MDKILRYVAYAACAAQVVFIAALLPDLRGDEFLIMALLTIPPLLAAAALYLGPDAEERRMIRRVRKMKLQQELIALGVEDKSKAG